MSTAAPSRWAGRCTTPPKRAFPYSSSPDCRRPPRKARPTGSRNEFIQWIQDVPDQRGIVRQYMKYDNEFRSPHNVKQIVHRSLQFAHSDPKGPVYLVGAREIMEAEAKRVATDIADWPPIAPAPLPEAAVVSLVDAMQKAARPLIVTSYVGRNPAAVTELVGFCGRLGVGVLESVPSTVNFPHNDPMYQGNHWNHPFQNPALKEADFVLVVDSDVPWIPTVNKPSAGAAIAIIDVDPLKESTPLWSIKARRCYRADAATAFAQLNARLDSVAIDEEAAERRRRHYAARHQERKADARPPRSAGRRRHHAGIFDRLRAPSGRARGRRAQ